MQAIELEEMIEKQFGKSAVTEERLKYYRLQSWIANTLTGQMNVNSLLEKVGEFLAAAGEPKRASPEVEFVVRTRDKLLAKIEAQSLLLAHFAAKDDAVVCFRNEHLKDKLLKVDEVAEWIKKAAEFDRSKGGVSSWVSFPFDSDLNHTLTYLPATHTTQTRFLEYPLVITVKEKTGPRRYGIEERIPIPTLPDHGGILYELDRTAKKLKERFGWQAAQSVAFVLTGETPWRPSVQLQYSDVAAGRLLMSVDVSTTPRELDRYYRSLRNRHGLTRHTKSLTEKHVQLAVLACDREGKKQSWSTAFKSWNKRVKRNWRYSVESNFRRDVLKARERLLVAVGCQDELRRDEMRRRFNDE